jgi:hypothetical protein
MARLSIPSERPGLSRSAPGGGRQAAGSACMLPGQPAEPIRPAARSRVPGHWSRTRRVRAPDRARVDGQPRFGWPGQAGRQAGQAGRAGAGAGSGAPGRGLRRCGGRDGRRGRRGGGRRPGRAGLPCVTMMMPGGLGRAARRCAGGGAGSGARCAAGRGGRSGCAAGPRTRRGVGRSGQDGGHGAGRDDARHAHRGGDRPQAPLAPLPPGHGGAEVCPAVIHEGPLQVSGSRRAIRRRSGRYRPYRPGGPASRGLRANPEPGGRG